MEHGADSAQKYLKLTELLADKLDIQLPPIALGLVDQKPPNVPALVKESPSFCTLWRWAEQSVFYAAADQHLGCAIGGMVAGFLDPEDRLGELAVALDEMCEVGQGTEDEIAQTPRFIHDRAGIVYGPLWKLPVIPDLALIWATLPQMGVLQEIIGTVLWRDNPQGAIFTRPACGVLAIAKTQSKPAMSLGCIGMRLYTNIPPQLFLVAIPQKMLVEVERGLYEKPDTSERLQFYQEKLARGH